MSDTKDESTGAAEAVVAVATDGGSDAEARKPEPTSAKALMRAQSSKMLKPARKKTRYQVRQADFSWQHVSVRVKDKKAPEGSKEILHNVSGCVKPGQVVGILGPSGSGKTTLLTALAGKFKGGDVYGRVLMDGTAPDHMFKRHVSYVAQENALLGVLTVRETMEYAALLSGAGTGEQAKEMIDDTLHELGMTDCAGTRVGDIFMKGISGGQQRRLSIGVELLKQPSLVIMDEPTSGLDSAAAHGVVANMRELAAAGRGVLATLHQPASDVFAMLDKVILLSKGKVIYNGPVEDVVDHFAALGYECPTYTNPADYLLNLVNTDFEGHADLEELHAAYVDKLQADVDAEARALDSASEGYAGPARMEDEAIKSAESRAAGTQLKSFEARPDREYACSYWTQFTALASRNFLNNLRNPGVFWIRVFMYSCLSFMVGTMFLGMGTEYHTIQDRFTLLFYVAAFFVFMSIAALPFFIQTRAVFQRERANGAYALLPYVISNFITFLPGLILITAISCALIYPLAELNSADDRFWWFAGDLFMSLVVAESFMMVLAALVPHYIVGIALGAGCFGMWMLSEGFMVQKDNIPDGWIWSWAIGFHTYSFRLFINNEFDGLTFGCPASMIALLPDGAPCSLDGTTDILTPLGMEDVDKTADLLILGLFTVIYQGLFYIILYVQYGRVASAPKVAAQAAVNTPKAIKDGAQIV